MLTVLLLTACLNAPAETTPDLADTAAAAGSFQLLLTAAERAGLVEALKGTDELTVLAPTDEAFQKLPDGLLDKLLLPENQASLTSLLKYHVLPGSRSAASLLESGKAATLGGPSVGFELKEGRLRVENARILNNDISARNGVIHVIDQVLIPEGFAIPERSRTPAALIELAVRRGAPLFNSGNVAACAAIYEVAARSLLMIEDGQIGAASQEALRTALDQAAASDQPTRNAWTLRRALDTVWNEVAAPTNSEAEPASSDRWTSVYEFDQDETQASSRWFSVNDNVMGGISQGGMKRVDDSIASFQGALSLENNGGFSTVRSAAADLGLAGHEGLVIRVRGDGRTYALSALKSDGRGTIRTWKRDFQTRSGQWQELRIPFSAMELSVMGRRFPGSTIDPAEIRSLAFSIADKNEAPFRLDIDWVRAYRNANPSF